MYPGAYLATSPNKPAIVSADTGRIVTFAELESKSIRIARTFRHDLGLEMGDHVAVVSTNRVELFDVYWAAMRSGLYVTMVNWHLTPAEAAYIVDDCDAKVVIVDSALEEIAAPLRESASRVDHFLSFAGRIADYTDLDELSRSHSDEPLPVQPRGADMLYSSGTTGTPKGIKPDLPDREIHEAGDPMTVMNATFWGAGPSTVYLSPAPLYHAAPLRTCASVTALGGTVVIVERFDAEQTLALIEKYKITYGQFVPTMFVRMLRLSEATRRQYDISSLEVVVHAAAPCPVEIKRQMIDWWGPILSEYYSSTELNGLTLVDTAQWILKPGTVGRPVLGVLHVCADDGTEVEAGSIGRIYFERDKRPFEYHKAGEKTLQAQHPEHPAWTTTGDVGYVDDDGYLFLTDRDSFMIISGGVNIYPQEIENALLEHPLVLDAGVIGVPDPEMGELVVAVVQPNVGVEGTDAFASELVAFLGRGIAKYKLPRRVVFSVDLPRTPTGKLVKRTLVDRIPRI